MGKFAKHLGKAEEVVLKYADGTTETLNLKPLTWEDVNDLVLIGKDLGQNPDNAFEKLNNETIERIKHVVLKTMTLSYPEEPEEELKAFTARNFMNLIPIVMDLNFAVGSSEKLEKIRAKQDAIRKISSDKATE